MTIPNLLLSTLFATPGQVGELLAGTSYSQLGNNVTGWTAETLGATVKGVGNRTVEFRNGQYQLYFDGSNYKVAERDQGGADTWGTVFTCSGTQVSGDVAGLFVTNVGSLAVLAVVYFDGTVVRMATSATGAAASFTDTATAIAVDAGQLGKNPSCLMGSKLYSHVFNSAAAPNMVEVNLELGSGRLLTVPWASAAPLPTNLPLDMIVEGDRLLVLTTSNTPSATGPSYGNWVLYEFDGDSTFTSNVAIHGDNRNGADEVQDGQCALLLDGTKLLAFVNGQGASGVGNGTLAYSLTPSGSTFTVSDVTTPVVPAGLRPGARASADAREDRWWTVVINTDPDNPETYLFHASGPAPGTNYVCYQYIDDSTVLTEVGTSLATTYGLPLTKVGGGEVISFAASGSYAVIESDTVLSTTWRLNFRLYGTQGPTDYEVRFSLDQERPSVVATLAGAATTIPSLTGDDGATLRTVEVDLVASSITPPDVSSWQIVPA